MGPRGRVFLSYRWSGDDFGQAVRWTALQLVRRGYEVVLDKWYAEPRAQVTGDGPAEVMLRELAASRFFVAAISPDYLRVLYGSSSEQDWGAEPHDVANDGWARDELDYAIHNQERYEGIGLCFGRKIEPDPRFPFPTFEITGSDDPSREVLDSVFGPELDLPERVRPEIKIDGQWTHLPVVPLFGAYLMLRQALAATQEEPDHHYYLPVEISPYWCRIDRRHVVWEARATSPEKPIDPRSGVLACPNCTTQYQSSAPMEPGDRCPLCARGDLEVRLPAKVEALAVLRPEDAI